LLSSVILILETLWQTLCSSWNSIGQWDITWTSSYISGRLACEWLYLPVAAYLLWINFKIHGIWQEMNQYHTMWIFMKIALSNDKHCDGTSFEAATVYSCYQHILNEFLNLALKFANWTSRRINLKASYWKELVSFMYQLNLYSLSFAVK
jgi:hypothetical protein